MDKRNTKSRKPAKQHSGDSAGHQVSKKPARTPLSRVGSFIARARDDYFAERVRDLKEKLTSEKAAANLTEAMEVIRKNYNELLAKHSAIRDEADFLGRQVKTLNIIREENEGSIRNKNRVILVLSLLLLLAAVFWGWSIA